MSHNIMSGQDTDIKTIKDTSGLGPVPETTLDYTLWWPTKEIDLKDGSSITTTNDFVGDPVFWPGGYHLGAGSAALDRGTGVGVASDIDGHPRPLGDDFDLGADEALFGYLPLLLK
jgi:hypothetical protein